MGLHDTIQPTLLASQDMQHFILVNLRLKQKDSDFTLSKFVLRRGREGDYKTYEMEWEDSGVVCHLLGEGKILHQPAEKKMLILTRQGEIHKMTYGILKKTFPDYHLQWIEG